MNNNKYNVKMENNTIETITTSETINAIESLNHNYFNFDLNTILNNTPLVYSIGITTFFTAIWIYREKPSKKTVFMSYPVSLFMRYKFFPIYLWMDSIQIFCGIMNLVEKDKIKIL